MILMGLTFFVVAILYNAETCPMWKIFSVPCGSALYKFYCICDILREREREREARRFLRALGNRLKLFTD
jgi:hypothetical protein